MIEKHINYHFYLFTNYPLNDGMMLMIPMTYYIILYYDTSASVFVIRHFPFNQIKLAACLVVTNVKYGAIPEPETNPEALKSILNLLLHTLSKNNIKNLI